MYEKPHIFFANLLWKNFLKKDFNVIDATCGNGYDSLFLAKIVKKGSLFCIDIQKKAIENTKLLLSQTLNATDLKRIKFMVASHENLIEIVSSTKIHLIVYNLGYLPKGDKKITTKKATTLKSVSSALKLLEPKGAISITCYPGHLEGQKEEKSLFNFLKSLDPANFSINYFTAPNKKMHHHYFGL